jgi:outer membrane protein insertion porin family
VGVQEKSTGEINLGAGFSSADGALADIGMRETNLLGRGQELRARLTYAARRKQAELGFTEPYFLNRELAAGFDVFRTQYDFISESSYNLNSTGFNLRMGYALSEHLQHSINYSLRDNDITDVRSFASRFIRDQEGRNVNSAIGHALTYDTRNSRFDPTSGYYLRFGQEFAGLGGDSKYIKHEVKSAYYYPIAKNWTWSAGGATGHLLGIGGEDIRISDRFFIGGEEIRGFDNAGIGPRDITTGDALGGNIYYAANTELRFPLGLPDDLGFLGAVFLNAGNLWDIDDRGPEVVDSNTIRVSAGVGVSWASPFGPIRIDISHPIVKEDEDVKETFRFSFGTRF